MLYINHVAKGNNLIRRLSSKIGGISHYQLPYQNTPIFEVKRRINQIP
jgi:hypothetical protein